MNYKIGDKVTLAPSFPLIGFARKVVSARKVTNTIIALVISNYRQFDLT